MPQTKQTKSWIVTTSPDRSIQDIAKDLKDAGFTVDAVNDEIQSITGSAADETAGKARSVKGVVDVSPDEPIDIGPPGSPDSW
jgi:hypothetical protein